MATTRVRQPEAWVVAIGAATVAALVVRLWGIGHQSFWYDESLTVDEMHMRFLRMLSSVRLTEVTPPLYFASAWMWAKLAGSGEVGLRSLSALAGALTVPAVAACAATLAGRRAAVIAATLVAVNPLLIWYSQEARAYALMTLLCALSWLFFLRAARDGGRRDLVLWAAASALALASHYFALFLVAPEVLWLVARAPRGRAAWGAVLSVGAVGLALLPFAISRRTNGTRWIHEIPLQLRLRQIADQFAGGFSDSRALVAVAAALVALALGGLVLRADRPTRRAALAALATAAVAFALPLVLGRFGLDYLITRNVLFVLVPLTVLVAIGLAGLRARWLGTMTAVGLAAVGVAAAARVDSSAALQRPDWRLVTRALGPQVRDRAIVVAGSYRGRPVKTYLRHTGFMSKPPPAVREIDVIGMRSRREPGCWWGAECNLPNATPATQAPAPGFRLSSQIRVGSFVVARFSSVAPAAFASCSPVFRSPERFRGRRRIPVIVLVQRVHQPRAPRPTHRAPARHAKPRPGRSRFGCPVLTAHQVPAGRPKGSAAGRSGSGRRRG